MLVIATAAMENSNPIVKLLSGMEGDDDLLHLDGNDVRGEETCVAHDVTSETVFPRSKG